MDRSPDDIEARIGTLLDDLASYGDEARASAEELVSLLVELYGAGLARVVTLLGDDATRLVDDELVAALLVLHGLHPDDPVTRVERAVDQVRQATGCAIDFLGVDDDGVARFVTHGGTAGACGPPVMTVGLLLETAVVEAAPELSSVVVTRASESVPAPGVPVAFGPTRSSRAGASS